MTAIQIPISDRIMRRIAAEAKQLDVSPELIAMTALETVFGPTSSDIEREIESDPELKAMLERSEEDIREGRIYSHEEIMEWHRSHPE